MLNKMLFLAQMPMLLKSTQIYITKAVMLNKYIIWLKRHLQSTVMPKLKLIMHRF